MKRVVVSLALLWCLFSGTQHCCAERLDYLGSALSIGVYDFDIAGSYAYCTFANGLQVLDISDPATPRLVGHLHTYGLGTSVCVNGTYAYIAGNSPSLKIIDISNPEYPILVDSCIIPELAQSIKISGDYAFLACGDIGLVVADITDPHYCSVVGTCDTPGNAKGLSISGNYAYVADLSQGMQVIDISNPANPTIVAQYVLVGDARAIVVRDSYAYIADGASGIEIYNISDPANPALAGFNHSGHLASDIVLDGDYAYLADSLGLRVINISDPSNPVPVGSYFPEGNYDSHLSIYSHLSISGGNVIITGIGLFEAIDVINPASPTIVGKVKVVARGYPAEITVIGNYAYVIDIGYGLRVVDISNPRLPFLVGGYHPPVVDINFQTIAGGGFAYGNYAYIMVSPDYADAAALYTVNISDPTNPTYMCRTGVPQGMEVFADSSHVYVSGGLGLDILGFDDRHRPSPMASCRIGWTGKLFVSGGYAYVCGVTPWLLNIIDLNDPGGPTVVGAIPGGGDVFVRGNYAYIGGLSIADISVPSNPHIISNLNNCGGFTIFVNGNSAIGADFNDSLKMVDVSNPFGPRYLCSYPGRYIGDIASSANNIIFSNAGELIILKCTILCSSVAGDANGDQAFNGLDVVFCVNYLKGIGWAPCSADCPPHDSFPVSSDANGDCRFNGLDVVYDINCLKGIGDPPISCPDCLTR